MKFLIVTHVVHKKVGDAYFAYGPYVKEMNLWFRHVDEIVILAPKVENQNPDPIDLAYLHPKIKFVQVPEFSFLDWSSRIKTVFYLPLIFLKTWIQMAKADHIHLRCPGNMGLVGTLVQILFPSIVKSAKYAGNWDPKSDQPSTYRLQKKILGNEFFTRKMKVLVYGNWAPKSRNLISFFTASYLNSDKKKTEIRSFGYPLSLKLIFVGSLHPGKNPMISCTVAELLLRQGIDCQLNLYGEGVERQELEQFIEKNSLQDKIYLHGNVNSETLKNAYSESHFLIFASESEGWPKAVAEAMFWGCLPVTTAVSCVPEIVEHGERGELVPKDPKLIIKRIQALLADENLYRTKAQAAMDWSRTFTLEKFESEIQKVLQN